MPLHESIRDQFTLPFRKVMEIEAQKPPLWEMTPVKAREVLNANPIDTSCMQTAHTVENTEAVRSDGLKVPIRIWTPTTPAPEGGFPAVIHFHGGGWTVGDLDHEAVICSTMCARGQAVVISVDYRLAPENPFPACIVDVVETYKWMVSNADKLGINAEKIAASGGSAGGNLSAVLTHKILNHNKKVPERDRLPTVKYNLLYVPVIDFDYAAYPSNDRYKHIPDMPPEFMEWFCRHYTGGREDVKNPDLSPLYGPDENFDVYPPTFIAVAEMDVLYDQGWTYAAKLMKHSRQVSYKSYKGVGHFFMIMQGAIPESDELALDLAKHVHQYFYGEPSAQPSN